MFWRRFPLMASRVGVASTPQSGRGLSTSSGSWSGIYLQKDRERGSERDRGGRETEGGEREISPLLIQEHGLWSSQHVMWPASDSRSLVAVLHQRAGGSIPGSAGPCWCVLGPDRPPGPLIGGRPDGPLLWLEEGFLQAGMTDTSAVTMLFTPRTDRAPLTRPQVKARYWGEEELVRRRRRCKHHAGGGGGTLGACSRYCFPADSWLSNRNLLSWRT